MPGSKAELAAQLRDADSARYQNVGAYRYKVDSGPPIYLFCGEVNAKNAFGGYTGFQQFVAAPTIAGTAEADNFDQAWAKFCTDRIGEAVF
jgi:hypothetical protein